ncbi:N-acetylglucosaminyl-phosphatidylinositol de-N-acetylase-like [Acipenser ruthenus]|uniref:N-acetylglucosaminyl-phosphatidylinositol de-N-acetylase-like n=1 Tax=Acipenser ruthenus TaxID=7906 RepID=UPI00145BE2EC|nr:N-acetylglucosaminyl-phosphatidylinositol de-N-acetylase-like [Acipenser ruthenus]
MLSFGLAVILSIVIYFVWLKRIYRQYRQCVAQNGTGYIVSLIQKASIAKDPDGICSHGKHREDGLPWPHADGQDQVSENLRVLFVTAHPDDECMFFAPAIIHFVKLNVSVYLLCLSAGNYYNQGEIRKKELLKSCGVLGIPAAHLTVIDCSELPDHPRVQWDTDLVSTLILKQVEASAINLVLTFDKSGVSGHVNHITLYRSLRYLSCAGKLPEGCCALALETVNIFRKYVSIFELPISWFSASDFIAIIWKKEYGQAKRAMCCHDSQMLWFRQVYLLFSRYMFINTFRLISEERQR